MSLTTVDKHGDRLEASKGMILFLSLMIVQQEIRLPVFSSLSLSRSHSDSYFQRQKQLIQSSYACKYPFLDDLIFFPFPLLVRLFLMRMISSTKNDERIIRTYYVSRRFFPLSFSARAYIRQLLLVRVVYPCKLHSGHISRSSLSFFVVFVYTFCGGWNGIEKEIAKKKRRRRTRHKYRG